MKTRPPSSPDRSTTVAHGHHAPPDRSCPSDTSPDPRKDRAAIKALESGEGGCQADEPLFDTFDTSPIAQAIAKLDADLTRCRERAARVRGLLGELAGIGVHAVDYDGHLSSGWAEVTISAKDWPRVRAHYGLEVEYEADDDDSRVRAWGVIHCGQAVTVQACITALDVTPDAWAALLEAGQFGRDSSVPF